MVDTGRREFFLSARWPVVMVAVCVAQDLSLIGITLEFSAGAL